MNARYLGALTTLLRGATPLFLVTGLQAQSALWSVDSGGAGDFTQLQAAIDAASSGDTLLVHAGSYSAFNLRDKGLTLLGAPGDEPQVTGISTIRSLAEGSSTRVLGGLHFEALRVVGCSGSVWVEGGMADRIDLLDSGNVVVVDQVVDALVTVTDATLFLHNSLVTGAPGDPGWQLGNPPDPGCPVDPFADCGGCELIAPGPGRIAFAVRRSTVYAVGSQVEGGQGGDTARMEDGCLLFDGVFNEGGQNGAAGGAGVRFLDASSRFVQVGGSVQGGAGSRHSFHGFPGVNDPTPQDGSPGPTFEGPGVTEVVVANPGLFDVPSVWESGFPTTLSFLRSSGGLVFWSWRLTSEEPAFAAVLGGVLHTFEEAVFAGVASPGAPLLDAAPTVSLPPQLTALPVVFQSFWVDLGPLRITAGQPGATVLMR